MVLSYIMNKIVKGKINRLGLITITIIMLYYSLMMYIALKISFDNTENFIKAVL